MKNTYRIAKVLKKLANFNFNDSFQKIELSKKGKQKANQYYQSHPSLKTTIPNGDTHPDELESDRETYIRFQKEVKAAQLLKTPNQPKAPGKVLKLPIEDMED